MSLSPFVLATLLAAQVPQAPDTTRPQEALRIFLDCAPWICNLDYFRTEIPFVSYMRDRTDAQIFVLVTTQQTGSGGTEHTITLLGQREFAGRADTVRYATRPTDTEDERRRGLVRLLRLMLVRYTLASPLAQHIDVRFQPPAGAAAPVSQQRDRWNFWVFRLQISGNLDGESSYRSRRLSYSASASRITEAWKIDLSVRRSDSRQTFEIDDTTEFVSRRDNWDVSSQVVRSLTGHWSAGLWTGLSHSSYTNTDLRASARTGVEFDVFPYSESTRRLFTLSYSIGLESTRYIDSTIFFLLRETRGKHGMAASLQTVQPWGSIYVSASSNQYLHDTKKVRADFFGNVSLRLVRGLSVSGYGGYSIVRDQLYLPAAGATRDEIIARQRALRTNYSYWGGLSLRYTFGSVYNNIVNPRFGGGGGVFFID